MFVDLDADGILEVIAGDLEYPPVSEPEDQTVEVDPPMPQRKDSIFRLTPAGFERTEALMFGDVFRRGSGNPFTARREFNAAAANYTMRIVNGGRNLKPSSSATITLNGVVLARPADLKKGQAIVDMPVRLSENNLLTVELSGEPGTAIAVLILQRQ